MHSTPYLSYHLGAKSAGEDPATSWLSKQNWADYLYPLADERMLCTVTINQSSGKPHPAWEMVWGSIQWEQETHLWSELFFFFFIETNTHMYTRNGRKGGVKGYNRVTELTVRPLLYVHQKWYFSRSRSVRQKESVPDGRSNHHPSCPALRSEIPGAFQILKFFA